RQRKTDEDDTIDCDPAPLQNISDACRARDAVAFAREEERRIPCLESVPIDADELGHRLGVAACLIELWGVFRFRRTAIASANRIKEEEIRLMEPRPLIVARRAVGSQASRTESQQMHER